MCTLNAFELCADEATSQDFLQDAELGRGDFNVS